MGGCLVLSPEMRSTATDSRTGHAAKDVARYALAEPGLPPAPAAAGHSCLAGLSYHKPSRHSVARCSTVRSWAITSRTGRRDDRGPAVWAVQHINRLALWLRFDPHMAMILPERTVDIWTATYITGRRWRARLWAPTEQQQEEGYDLGVGLGQVGGFATPAHADRWPNKVFVFENKGVEDKSNTGTPIIRIRCGQMLDHFYGDRARGGGLVYYVLPNPEWNKSQRAPSGTLPDVSVRRTRGPTLPPPTRGPAWDGFQRWAMVAHVESIAELLYSFCTSKPDRFTQRSPTAKRPYDWDCQLYMSDLVNIPGCLPLRDFVSAVRACKRGRLASEPGVLGPAASTGVPPGQLGPSLDELRRALGRALGREFSSKRAARRDIRNRGRGTPNTDTLDTFALPAFLTFYAVGDSEQDHDWPRG